MIGFPLYRIQQVFQDYLTDQDFNSTCRMEDITVDTTQISAEKRLKIYYDAYRLRLLEILENDFPKLQTLLGDEAFDSLGCLYITTHPSQHFSARYFGQKFAQFLRERDISVNKPYLAEMAAFEWSLGNTLDAENATTVTIADLKLIPADQWGGLKLRFHPSLQTCIFEWDTPQCWKAIENNESPRLPQKQKEPVTWIFWRQVLQSQFRSLTNPQALMLKRFQEDQYFGDICESLSQIMESEVIPAIALGFIQQCLNDGFVSQLSLK